MLLSWMETFFSDNELPGRDMSEIPHPFILESMELMKDLKPQDRSKVHFIHFNHTNPAHKMRSEEGKQIFRNGFRISRQDQFESL